MKDTAILTPGVNRDKAVINPVFKIKRLRRSDETERPFRLLYRNRQRAAGLPWEKDLLHGGCRSRGRNGNDLYRTERRSEDSPGDEI